MRRRRVRAIAVRAGSSWNRRRRARQASMRGRPTTLPAAFLPRCAIGFACRHVRSRPGSPLSLPAVPRRPSAPAAEPLRQRAAVRDAISIAPDSVGQRRAAGRRRCGWSSRRGCRSARRTAAATGRSSAPGRSRRAAARRRTARPGRCVARPARPTCSSRSAARAASSRVDLARRPAWRPARSRRPCTAGAGGGPGRRSRPGALRNRASSLASRANGSTPSSVTVPPVGRSSVPRMFSSVLLPDPLGPTIASDSPGQEKRHAAQHDQRLGGRGVLLAEVGDGRTRGVRPAA